MAQPPKMPTEMQTEVAQLHGLKHVGTPVEKVILPSKEDLEEERHRESIKQGIQQFEKSELHHVNTEEKVILPSPTDIAMEKAPQMAAEFNHETLKHVEPTVKTGCEVIDSTNSNQ